MNVALREAELRAVPGVGPTARRRRASKVPSGVARRVGRLVRQRLIPAIVRSLPPGLVAHELSLLRYRITDRPLWVPPEAISAKPSGGHDWESIRRSDRALAARLEAQFVVDGDWDQEPHPFTLHPAVSDVLVDRLPVHEAPARRRMVEALQDGDGLRSRGYTSEAEIDAYFERIIGLAASMAADGFKTQRELGQPSMDGTRVCIGRTGQLLLLRNGNHRTSIAKVLRLPAIPVYVVGVHPLWIDRCQRRYGEENPVWALEAGLADLPRSEGVSGTAHAGVDSLRL